MDTLAKILIVDNDPSVGEDLATMLDPRKYETHLVTGNGMQLLQNAIRLGQQIRPHIAIVDVRLLDDYTDETSGIKLLEPLASAKCILYSSHLTATITRDARRHGAYEWINKADDPELLLQIIEDAATIMSARQKQLTVHWPDSWKIPQIVEQVFATENDAPSNPVDHNVLNDVLVQLFPQQQRLYAATLSGAIVTITGPHPQGRGLL